MSDRRFTELVHALMVERHLTLEAVADELELEPAALEDFLTDRSTVPIAVLEGLLASLRVPPPEFFARLYRTGIYRETETGSTAGIADQ
jgi:transcriptional regulator with XRE-family HTH domain